MMPDKHKFAVHNQSSWPGDILVNKKVQQVSSNIKGQGSSRKIEYFGTLIQKE